MSRQKLRTRLGLEAKAVCGLILLGAAPLAVVWVFSSDLVEQLGDVATRVASGKADRLIGPLERANEAYQEAVAARRDAARKGAAWVAASPELARLCDLRLDRDEPAAWLRRLLDQDPTLVAATLFESGKEVASAERRAKEPVRELTLNLPLDRAPSCSVSLVSSFRAKLLEDNEALGRALQEHRALERIRLEIPDSYRYKFLLLIGGVALVATFVAVWVARRTTRRIARLVHATRRVGEGDLGASVELEGKDELADLAASFNQMVGDLKSSRAEIEYLQKIGAWQEVARRLAHEIKNPLTPIQLAVQQLQAKYGGKDLQFKQMLADAHTIVTEEVAGLRRLVDAFSGFAKLPRVDPKPLDLKIVVEDALREIDFVALPPAAPALVSGDRLLLRKALVNLVENARNAGATQVTVAWRVEPEYVTMTVADNGSGVPDSIRDRLFDPYVTTRDHGTGLGLAMVKKTLLDHGGDVTLGPPPAAGGARFELRIPRRGAAAATTA